MNPRSFVQPPWLEIGDGEFAVVVEAYHWCGHPRWGSSVLRFPHRSLAAAVAHLDRLGFTVPEEILQKG